MSDAAPASIAPMTTANATSTIPSKRTVATDDEDVCDSDSRSGLVMAGHSRLREVGACSHHVGPTASAPLKSGQSTELSLTLVTSATMVNVTEPSRKV